MRAFRFFKPKWQHRNNTEDAKIKGPLINEVYHGKNYFRVYLKLKKGDHYLFKNNNWYKIAFLSPEVLMKLLSLCYKNLI